ncbi:hybrid sensor histidine kinase/response regulator [Pseudoalteromonas phenolica]|uniref:histidine kinase n=1 Tax=Pseudoalteromonas phenolica TaxID=161398 RepID=A0A0S2K8X2_9GAMM|nr:ATP-binding protein [Pseudoalteromonas phenolica]ALO44466.1 ATPase [Pseudoalteromonas phenolica]MBE0357485.1 hypothetical protein [Pseudoalteromonas phenolica O-BC30]
MNTRRHITSTRRTYNKLVANEMMEDFALRYTPKSARQWSLNRIAITALGFASFLLLEAIGGAITLNFGFTNAAWAILAVTTVIFLFGLPISYYAAKYGVDIDLLSRGAGFGYIGSTIASLIYASFTFIFFALEASIMSMALHSLMGVPVHIAYLFSAIVILPLVMHGISYISSFQAWTQPLWILLQIFPFYFLLTHADSNFTEWVNFTGSAGDGGANFNLLLFGSASAVLLSLVAQIGEQVDILRFLPAEKKATKWQWWLALLAGGPGWIIVGAIKLFLGSFLAYFALQQGVAIELADDPAHMYNLVFKLVFESPTVAAIVACIFIVICQLKINVANAYAGSLAWSNFFSRITHNHPGRVVWVIFNVVIAFLLMELGVYHTIEKMLTVYSVIVLAWLSSVVADLTINKPLGLSPKHIEFKRSHLFDINPVGVGSMFIAALAGFIAHAGILGEAIKALASYISCLLPFMIVPFLGWLTKGKYYLVRANQDDMPTVAKCHICENTFEKEDMTFCPAYNKNICSLCCSLDVRCGDECRSKGVMKNQLNGFFKRFLSTKLLNLLSRPLAQSIYVTLGLSFTSAGIFFLIYQQISLDGQAKEVIANTLIKVFFVLLIIIGVVSWLFVLARRGNRLALKELRAHTKALAEEASAHDKTLSELKGAKEAAEMANEAKSRYLTNLSHELRTPLNVMLGYAQLFCQDTRLSQSHIDTFKIIKRNGDHLSDLIEGLLELSKIEAGRLCLHRDECNLKTMLQQLVDMFQMHADKKGITFRYQPSGHIPDYVITDKQRFRQVLINLLSNSIKYTEKGSVTFRVSYRNEVATFSIQDTGEGISSRDQKRIFQPFEQIRSTHNQAIGGTGLGLTISSALIELMGGEITLDSQLGKGSTFGIRLMMPSVYHEVRTLEQDNLRAKGYFGERKAILIVDDDKDYQKLLVDFLSPLGFILKIASDAKSGLEILHKNRIDLAILDVRMSAQDGWQMVKTMRKQNLYTPVLMVSANARDNESSLAAQGYHNGYLTKPINLNTLLIKIGQLMMIKWQSDKEPEIQALSNSTPDFAESNKMPAKKEHYMELIAMAEIGYLSGFKSKLIEIETSFFIPDGVTAKLNQYLQQCNFPKIVEYLREVSCE